MPASTDYWINDRSGDPLLVITGEVDAVLTKAFPRLLGEVRDLVGERRVTIVFDRGGWSPKLFATMIKDGFDLLTYRKGRCRRINEQRFIRRRAELDGCWVDYLLHDQPVRFLKGKLRLKAVPPFLRQPPSSNNCRYGSALIVAERQSALFFDCRVGRGPTWATLAVECGAPPPGKHRWTVEEDTEALVRELARMMPDRAIASILNRAGKVTGRHNGWTESRVRGLRNRLGVSVYREGERTERGELTLDEAAAALKVSTMTILRMIRNGVLPARQLCKGAPWVIKAADLDNDAVRAEAMDGDDGR
jgi:excisionase family DNA binding protein